jgi:DNA polymerase V
MKKGDTSSGVVFHVGFPNAGEDQPAIAVSLDRLVIRHPASTYFWRLDGEGMPETGWQPGALVVVDRALDPHQGSLVVATCDEDFVVRRFHRGKLLPLGGQPEEAGELHLWGVITHVLQEYR